MYSRLRSKVLTWPDYVDDYEEDDGGYVMTHKYRGSQQSSREVKPKFIDSTQGEPKDIYKL
jgi:hypothetical protein